MTGGSWASKLMCTRTSTRTGGATVAGGRGLCDAYPLPGYLAEPHLRPPKFVRRGKNTDMSNSYFFLKMVQVVFFFLWRAWLQVAAHPAGKSSDLACHACATQVELWEGWGRRAPPKTRTNIGFYQFK